MSLRLEAMALVVNENGELVAQAAGDGDAALCPERLALQPMPGVDGALCPALALTSFDETRALLAYAAMADGAPFCQYLLTPYATLAATMPLRRIIDLLPLTAGEIPAQMSAPEPRDITRIDSRFEREFDLTLTVLGALLEDGGLRIINFTPDFGARLQLIDRTRRLLPRSLATSVRFATHDIDADQPPHLVFATTADGHAGNVIDWAGAATVRAAGAHPYLDLLRDLWQGDAAGFARCLRSLDRPAGATPAQDLAGELAWVARRFALDQKTETDGDIDSGDILRVLDEAAPPSGQLRRRYLRRLLQNALRDRDAAAGGRVADELDADPILLAEVQSDFDDMLETQPDAVYVFIRNRLNRLGMDESWLPLLKAAARASLEVALEDGDAPTLISWLELFAHEPLRYQLQDVLREGVLAARERAHENGELGIHLILIAARRLPHVADALYADEALIAALPAKISRALRENSAAALEQLIDETPEYFLLALFHGIHTCDIQFVTVKPVRYLWSLRGAEKRVNLPVIYRPPAMIRELATTAVDNLTDDALDLHMKRIIKSDDRELFGDAAQILAQRSALFPWLGALLEDDSLGVDQALWVLNAASNLDDVAAHDVIDACFGLLDYYEWTPDTLPMMESLARWMGKSKPLHLTYRRLWRLFESCNAQQTENAARVALAHLLRQFDEEEDLTRIVDGITRISRQHSWSQALQDRLNRWWRDYAQSSSLARLQRLERELEAQRNLHEQKHILRTALAMRRWIPQGDPEAFADQINAACALIEHLSEAFDLAQLTEIDSVTVRRELDEIGDTLSADERHILANNLRRLAHVITQMAEKRSKPSFIRSDDSIDRQLTRGEANPHGSIDMMKWIAGYLGGAHTPDAG